MLNIASIEIYCELSLIFAILRNFRVAGANNIVFCYPIGQKKIKHSNRATMRGCGPGVDGITQLKYLHLNNLGVIILELRLQKFR